MAAPFSSEASAPGGAAEVSRHSSAMDSALSSFRGQEELLRGVDLLTVLRGAGRIFQNSAGSATTYALSQRTDSICAFISHNWVVSRVAKYAGLLVFYNFNLAVAAALVVSAAISALHVTGMTQSTSFCDTDDEDFGTFYYSLWCRVCGSLAFVSTLLFARNVVQCNGRRSTLMFLDKCCIPQDDPVKMRAAIEKLAAFIAASDEMVVLYTNIYLLKIWTVYEVASFLILHPDKTMQVVAVNRVLVYLIAMAALGMNWTLPVLLRITGLPPNLRFLSDISFCTLCMHFYRKHLRDRERTRRHLTNFTVRNCLCAVETDRAVVYRNIIEMMVVSGNASKDASDDEVLSAFDRLARQRLPESFRDELYGRCSFRLREYVVFGLMTMGLYSLDTLPSAASLSGRYGRRYWADCLNYLFWTVVGWPSLLMLAEFTCSFNIHFTGAREKIVIVLAACFGVALPGFCVDVAVKALARSAATSDAAMAALPALTLLGMAALHRLSRLTERPAAPGLDDIAPRPTLPTLRDDEPSAAGQKIGAADDDDDDDDDDEVEPSAALGEEGEEQPPPAAGAELAAEATDGASSFSEATRSL